jgi:hypothetical protein
MPACVTVQEPPVGAPSRRDQGSIELQRSIAGSQKTQRCQSITAQFERPGPLLQPRYSGSSRNL